MKRRHSVSILDTDDVITIDKNRRIVGGYTSDAVNLQNITDNKVEDDGQLGSETTSNAAADAVNLENISTTADNEGYFDDHNNNNKNNSDELSEATQPPPPQNILSIDVPDTQTFNQIFNGNAEATVPEIPNYHTNQNQMMRIDIRKINLFEMLPLKFLEFLEEKKIPTIANCDKLFQSGQSPYFQINDGLQCTREWGRDLEQIILENLWAVIKTDVQVGSSYTSTEREPIEQIKYDGNTITSYQKDLLYIAYTFMFGNDANDDTSKLFKFIHIEGKAGCGKTYVLSQLGKKKNINVTYCTLSNVLCNDIKNLYNVETKTFCSFVMNLFGFNYMINNNNVGFYSAVNFQRAMTHISPETMMEFDCEIFENHRKKKHMWRRLMYKHFIGCRKIIHMPLRIIFLDEYTLVSGAYLVLIIQRLKIIAEYDCEKILLIIAGDVNQILPLFVTPCHTYDFMDTMSDHTLYFNKQMRVTDQIYDSMLNRCLVQPKDTIGEYLLENFSNCLEPTVYYRYPIEIVINAPRITSPDEIELIRNWFVDNDISLINYLFCSYLNLEVHFNNMTIATTIFRQLNILNIEDSNYYIQFHLFRFVYNKKYHYRIPMAPDDIKLAAVALIRFFPYKLLVTMKCSRSGDLLPRSSILYLLDWSDTCIYMYSKKTKNIHKISQRKFDMNLFSNFKLYGFPIQLHCADTSHSLQGQTIDRLVCINPTNCSRRELYVMLSRVKTAERVHRLFVPR